MPETEPKYFTDFKEIILNNFQKIDERFGRIDERFTSLDNQLSDIRHDIRDVKNRLDSHAEQIAEMATDIVTIKHLLHKKADKQDLNELAQRVTKLEKIQKA